MLKVIARPDVQEKLKAHLNGPTNPLRNPEVLRRSIEANRRLGFPGLKARGGNGTSPSTAQKLLSEALGWPIEVVVPTRMPQPMPYHYKIDIAHEGLKIAIEVDGHSHQSKVRKAQDQRKEAFLRDHGWFVYRFTNREVIERLDEIVSSITSKLP